MFTLRQVESEEDIRETRKLFDEYVDWLGVNLCFQNYDKEVAELPGEYTPPTGRLLLALQDDQIAGCIALRKLKDGVCEMKRLFVRPAYRGDGLGRILAERIINEARETSYERMRLDTLPGKMDRAIAMYRRLGFVEIERYYDNPYEDALFMELDLK
jgi:ribosomal protein S18 acetylase RimI-like enzyme